jgi:hypothetical protein
MAFGLTPRTKTQDRDALFSAHLDVHTRDILNDYMLYHDNGNGDIPQAKQDVLHRVAAEMLEDPDFAAFHGLQNDSRAAETTSQTGRDTSSEAPESAPAKQARGRKPARRRSAPAATAPASKVNGAKPNGSDPTAPPPQPRDAHHGTLD